MLKILIVVAFVLILAGLGLWLMRDVSRAMEDMERARYDR